MGAQPGAHFFLCFRIARTHEKVALERIASFVHRARIDAQVQQAQEVIVSQALFREALAFDLKGIKVPDFF